MKVAILGTGSVGETLAKGFALKGHEVLVGTRDPDSKSFEAMTFHDAASACDMAVLCVNAEAAPAVAESCADALAEKLVMEASNAMDWGDHGAHTPGWVEGSVLQMCQRAAPEAHFVKAWNCVPGIMMVDPPFPGTQFICGDQGKQRAADILALFGWETVDVGGADMARYIEAMGLVVINHGARSGDWAWGLHLQHA